MVGVCTSMEGWGLSHCQISFRIKQIKDTPPYYMCHPYCLGRTVCLRPCRKRTG